MANVRAYNCTITKDGENFYFVVANGIDGVLSKNSDPANAQKTLEEIAEKFDGVEFRAFDREESKWITVKKIADYPQTMKERIAALEKRNADTDKYNAEVEAYNKKNAAVQA